MVLSSDLASKLEGAGRCDGAADGSGAVGAGAGAATAGAGAGSAAAGFSAVATTVLDSVTVAAADPEGAGADTAVIAGRRAQPATATARIARDRTLVRTTSLIMTSLLALKELLLADRDRLAPPPFLARERDVLPLHPRRSPFAIPRGKEEMIARREVRGMILPRPPLLAAGAARDRQQHACHQQQPDMIASHVDLPGVRLGHDRGEAALRAASARVAARAHAARIGLPVALVVLLVLVEAI